MCGVYCKFVCVCVGLKARARVLLMTTISYEHVCTVCVETVPAKEEKADDISTRPEPPF